MLAAEDVDRALAAALQRPLPVRKGFLDVQYADDPELRAALDLLLREVDESDPFLKPGGALEGALAEDLLAKPLGLGRGTRLGRYEIVSWLGAGGMGEVYRAHDTRLARHVALKILPVNAGSSGDALARFEREARAVAALNHPNILAIHDVGVEGDVRFAVTELLEGETLRERLASGRPLMPRKALQYGCQVAHGLAAAHARGIIHRDLKPENVFITDDGHVKILDFGASSFRDAEDRRSDAWPVTRTGVVIGTAGYTSPEQLVGARATAQSDLFAFGVVLYEMLTGVHPFVRATAAQTQAAVLRDDPPPIPDVAARFPYVVRLVEQCLEKQPARRSESAHDVALFLRALARSPAGAIAGSAQDSQAPNRYRVRTLAVMCGSVLLAMATTWGYVSLMADRFVRAALDAEVAESQRVVQRLHSEQIDRLRLGARLIASFPGLTAVFATDRATVTDFLRDYQQRTANKPILVAVGRDGSVLGRTDAARTVPAGHGDEWIAPLLMVQGEGVIAIVGEHPHLAVAVAAEVGGAAFGYVIAATKIDRAFAEALRHATQHEVLLLTRDDILASTLRAGETPWRSLQAWHADHEQSPRLRDVLIASRPYTAYEVSLATRPAISVLLMKPVTDGRAPYARIETGLLVIGLVAIGLAFLVSARLSPPLILRQ